MGVLRVSCIQMRSRISEALNIVELDWMVRAAAKEGALYIQTPEMCGILQKNSAALMDEISPMEDNPVMQHCSALSKELGVWLHLGSTAIKLDDKMAANRGALYSPDGIEVATYDKIHMFDVDVDENNRWKESSRYRAGEEAVIVDTGGFKLGMSICYDLRFPALYRQQAQAGATVLTCPSSFTKPTGEAHWQQLLQARAIENGAFVIAAAQGGKHQDGRETYGHSMVVGPWGDIRGELAHDEPGILTLDIDLQDVRDARAKIPNLENEKQFSISMKMLTRDLP